MSLVLESPGNLNVRSRKVLEFVRQWCGRRCQNIHARTPLFCVGTVSLLFTTCDSDEHILLYGCCYSTTYVVSSCCLSLYLNIAGLRQGRGKCFWGRGMLCNQETVKRALNEMWDHWTSVVAMCGRRQPLNNTGHGDSSSEYACTETALVSCCMLHW